MANIGSLTASLELQSAAFIRDLTRASQATDAHTRKMANSFAQVERGVSVVTKALGTFGIGLGVAQIAAYTKSVLDSAGGLGEMAEQLGTTAQKLQVYQALAIQSGVKSEQLQTSIAYLTRTIGDAAEGSDVALKAFNRLGIGILDAGGKVRSTDDVLSEAAKKIAALEDPTARAAAVADLFGAKAGSRLLPVLSALAQGYQLSADQAHALGLVLKDETIDALDRSSDSLARHQKQLENWYAEIVAGAVNAGDKFGAFIDKVDGWFAKKLDPNGKAAEMRRLLAEQTANPTQPLAPQIDPAMAEALRNGGVWNFGGNAGMAGVVPSRKPTLANDNTNPLSDSETKRIEAARKTVADLEAERDGANKTKAELLALRLARELNTAESAKMSDAAKKQIGAANAEAVSIQGDIDARARRVEAIKNEMAAQDELAQAAQQLAEYQARVATAEGNERKATQNIQDQAEAAGQATVRWNDLTESYEVNDRALRTVIETQRILNAESGIGYENARKLAEANVAANDNLVKAQQGAAKQARDLQRLYDDIGNIAERAFDRIGSSITDMFVRGEGAALDWKNVMLGVVSEVYQAILKLTVIDPIVKSIKGSLSGGGGGFGGLGSLFSLFGGGGGGGGAAGTLATATATIHTGMAAGASPTNFRSVDLALFAGAPKLHNGLMADEFPAILQKGEQVIPRGGRAGDGNVVNIYPDLRGASPDAVRELYRMVAELDANLEPRAAAASSEYARRHPKAFGKAA